MSKQRITRDGRVYLDSEYIGRVIRVVRKWDAERPGVIRAEVTGSFVRTPEASGHVTVATSLKTRHDAVDALIIARKEALDPAPPVTGNTPEGWDRIQYLKSIRDARTSAPFDGFPSPALEAEFFRLLSERYDPDGSHGLREPEHPSPGTFVATTGDVLQGVVTEDPAPEGHTSVLRTGGDYPIPVRTDAITFARPAPQPEAEGFWTVQIREGDDWQTTLSTADEGEARYELFNVVTKDQGQHPVRVIPPAPEIQCCGNWLPYPVPGRPSVCPTCKSTLATEPEVTDWPEGKKFGELTPAQRKAAVKKAAGQFDQELKASAEAIGQVLEDFTFGRIPGAILTDEEITDCQMMGAHPDVVSAIVLRDAPGAEPLSTTITRRALASLPGQPRRGAWVYSYTSPVRQEHGRGDGTVHVTEKGQAVEYGSSLVMLRDWLKRKFGRKILIVEAWDHR